jgi:hypothetical protein
MTPEEAKAKLVAYYKNKESKDPDWYRFISSVDLTTKISITELLEPWQKNANLSLPENIDLGNNVVIDVNGVKSYMGSIAWKDIFMTAVAEQSTYSNDDVIKSEHFFVACLGDGRIFEAPVTNMNEYSNLLGHFIEQYKLGQ